MAGFTTPTTVLPRRTAEVEVENVAYVICHAAGLPSDDYSRPYVAHWADGDIATIRTTVERVLGVARRALTPAGVGDPALAVQA